MFPARDDRQGGLPGGDAHRHHRRLLHPGDAQNPVRQEFAAC